MAQTDLVCCKCVGIRKVNNITMKVNSTHIHCQDEWLATFFGRLLTGRSNYTTLKGITLSNALSKQHVSILNTLVVDVDPCSRAGLKEAKDDRCCGLSPATMLSITSRLVRGSFRITAASRNSLHTLKRTHPHAVTEQPFPA
jgi:hypothetical protein